MHTPFYFLIVNVSHSCNFDSDLCNWGINNDSKTYFRWKRCRALSCDGPYVDHTLGSSEYKVPLISYYGILFIRWESICSWISWSIYDCCFNDYHYQNQTQRLIAVACSLHGIFFFKCYFWG